MSKYGTLGEKLAYGCGFAVLLVVLVAASWYIFYLAWNYVMPTTFGLPELTFWQAAILLTVVGCLGRAIRGK